MKDYFSLILIVAAVIIVGLGNAIAVIVLKWKKDKIHWEEESDLRYKKGKEEAFEIIRMTIDKIQDDKAKLSEMSEKDLMVESMLALGSYGRRLDRMEEKLIAISNYKAYIDSMNQQVQTLANNAIALQNNISEAGSQVTTFKQSISEIMNSVKKVNDSLADVGTIEQRVAELMSKLKNTVTVLENMNTQVNAISGKMDGFFDNYSESPMVLIKSIESLVSEAKDNITSVESTVDGLKGSLGTVQKTIDDVLDEYSSSSLFEKISEVESDVSSIKSDVYSLRSTVESSFDHYGYDSIFSKLDEIKGSLDTARHRGSSQ